MRRSPPWRWAVDPTGIVPATACLDASWGFRRAGSRLRPVCHPRGGTWWSFGLGGGHFGPEETGEFAGDGYGDDAAAALTGTESPKPGAQTLLGSPGPRRGGRVDAVLTTAQHDAEAGPVLVGPRRFDQLGTQVGVAGPGDVSTVDGLAGGVLAGNQTGEAHERTSGRETAPVTHLTGDRQRAQARDAAVGGQPGDRVDERSVGVPVGQISLDRAQFAVAGSQHRPVVGVRGPQRRLIEALPGNPLRVLTRPGVLAPDPVVAQQELTQPMPGTGSGQPPGPRGPGTNLVPPPPPQSGPGSRPAPRPDAAGPDVDNPADRS